MDFLGNLVRERLILGRVKSHAGRVGSMGERQWNLKKRENSVD